MVVSDCSGEVERFTGRSTEYHYSGWMALKVNNAKYKTPQGK